MSFREHGAVQTVLKYIYIYISERIKKKTELDGFIWMRLTINILVIALSKPKKSLLSYTKVYFRLFDANLNSSLFYVCIEKASK